MRITGGSLRGRQLRMPPKAVRPTQDRVRQALFSILGERVTGCAFLDLFAGCGTVGLEAWSRGAGSVWWVESDRSVLASLRKNVEELGCSTGRVVGMDVRGFLRRPISSEWRFNVIFADPPYAERHWRLTLLEGAREAGILAPGGVVILEEAKNRGTDASLPPGWRIVDERLYGETRLFFFEPEQGPGGERAGSR